MKKIHLGLPCLLFCIQVQAQDIAKGIVFQDANKNGKKEKNEKGLANVAISNGREVVLTDQSGNYQLPVQKDNIIFVVKPAGYQLPLNEYNQPRFYHIHKPLGTPASFKYKGTAPTGKLPASLDFPLYQTTEETKFTTLVFGDPQPYNLEEVAYFDRAIISETQNIQQVAFGLSLGDLVGDNLDLHLPYAKSVQKVGLPWYHVMGNHDMNYDATNDSLSDETFERNFGPANYAFNYGQAHFIILDDILYPDPKDGKGYWGGFRADQLEFLKNDLKQVPKDKLIVLSFHIPLLNKGEEAFRPDDRQAFFDLLQDYPNVLALSAHTHLQRQNFYGKEDGWKGAKPFHEYNAGTTSGDWYSGELNENGIPVSTMRDGTPKGYAFLRIAGNQYKIDYKVAGKPKEHQMNIFNPKVVAHNKRSSSGIYANFFMGAENDKVECRVDNGTWKDMDRMENADPTFLDRLHRWDVTEKLLSGRRPSNAESCTHLWRATIPTDLDNGAHTIEVRATDMFGRQFTETSTYTIAEPATEQ